MVLHALTSHLIRDVNNEIITFVSITILYKKKKAFQSPIT